MHLIINGQRRDSTAGTVAELIRELGIAVPHFAVAVNYDIIAKSEYEQAQLNDGDKVEIVHAVGGGSGKPIIH